MDTSNLSSLLKITSSPHFRRIPLQQAMAGENDVWVQQQEVMLRTGMELAIWEVAAFCALVLDTYPGIIGSILPQWSITEDRGQAYANMEVKLDGVFINNPDRIQLDKTVMVAMESVDAMLVLRATLDTCDNAVGPQLARHAEQINSAFIQPLTNADQARQIMARHAPYVSAWIEQACLEQQTPPAQGRVIKTGGRL